MGAAIKQLQRTVPQQKRGKKSKQWRAVAVVVQRLQQFFAVVPRRQQLGRRAKVGQKQKQEEEEEEEQQQQQQHQQQKQEQEQQQKQEQEQEKEQKQKREQKQKQQQKQEQKVTSKGRSLSNRRSKEPTSISD
jgi:cobalamin biosynthesis protein CobT